MTEITLLSADDLFFFNEGTHDRLYEKLGAHRLTGNGRAGTYFAVWAPNAAAVSVMGDFNGWSQDGPSLAPRGQSGIWEGFLPDLGAGDQYKYHIRSHVRGYRVDKADPFAFAAQRPPATASVIWSLDYDWGDQAWMGERSRRNPAATPMAIYEVHLGSWMRIPEEDDRSLTYRELAPRLAAYVREAGFTHVELLPVMEHPFYGSWGYQVTGYYAPTARYGTPQDLMFLIDYLHQHGIGVILDWVPSHFPDDAHGLNFFDGTHLYEHADPRRGFHPDWNSLIFNYGRPEVRAFLLSNARFWLDRYHADGLRVDAVASMIYLDYSREPGEWVPNVFGGRENLEAIGLLRRLNEMVYSTFPGAQTVAEESTAWPLVSRPTYLGGLGFGMKWDMGWMNDTLDYMRKDPIYRKFHHNNLTFRMLYAYSENFVLPLSHDEVVYGKRSLLSRMPGDTWQQFANLRTLLGYMYAHPGKKLLFMGAEFGQVNEWYHERSLDWHLLTSSGHWGVLRWVSDLNRFYRGEAAMHEVDFEPAGFEWIDANDSEQSTVSFLRRGASAEDVVLVICNFTPVPRFDYRVGVPRPGRWQEILNSDAPEYGGSGLGNLGAVEATAPPSHGRPQSLTVTLPPLAALFFINRGPRSA